MQAFLDLIAADETSPRVVLLHKALVALGLEVAPDEVQRRFAGPATRETVRGLQQRLGVPSDGAAVIDAATLAAVRRELKARGLVAGRRSFTVRGAPGVRPAVGSTVSVRMSLERLHLFDAVSGVSLRA